MKYWHLAQRTALLTYGLPELFAVGVVFATVSINNSDIELIQLIIALWQHISIKEA